MQSITQVRTVGEEIIQTQRNKKIFTIGNIQVHYENCYEIRKIPDDQIEQDLNVTNSLTSKDGSRFMKVTDIIVGNKRIRISDIYRFVNMDSPDYDPTMKNQYSKQKQRKIQIMKRTPYLPTTDHDQKRDTKNIVKNIVKLFTNWLSVSEDLQSQKAMNQLKSLLFQIKYNNKLINAIIQCQGVKLFFLRFLQAEAKEMIIASKINDKQSHLQAVNNYLLLYKRKIHNKQTSVSTKNNQES